MTGFVSTLDVAGVDVGACDSTTDFTFLFSTGFVSTDSGFSAFGDSFLESDFVSALGFFTAGVMATGVVVVDVIIDFASNDIEAAAETVTLGLATVVETFASSVLRVAETVVLSGDFVLATVLVMVADVVDDGTAVVTDCDVCPDAGVSDSVTTGLTSFACASFADATAGGVVLIGLLFLRGVCFVRGETTFGESF